MFDTAILALDSATPTRRWTTLASFTLQAFAVGVLLVIPLLYTDVIPQLHYTAQITAPSAPAPERVIELVTNRDRQRPTNSEIANDQLIQPRFIPSSTKRFVDPPDFVSNTRTSDIGVPFATGESSGSSLIEELITATRPAAPAPLAVARQPLKISTLSPGMLIQKVQPTYPPVAKATRTQGPVVMTAFIDTSGRVTSLKLVSGHPLLVQAAMDAVKQWRYRPYVLNGQAIDVETQITVIFTLQ